MACPSCHNNAVIEIAMTLESSHVTMHSCSRCDTRWWDRDGEVIGLGGVLRMIPRRRAA
jgi:Zn-finger nucleic acid-binding protein